MNDHHHQKSCFKTLLYAGYIIRPIPIRAVPNANAALLLGPKLDLSSQHIRHAPKPFPGQVSSQLSHCSLNDNTNTSSKQRPVTPDTDATSTTSVVADNEATHKRNFCHVCRKAFSCSSLLRRHQLIHNGKRPFKCDQCKECFARKDHLAAHRRVHSGERPYQCHVCSKTFTTSGGLKTHVRRHTGEKPFVCDVCHKGFVASCALTVHKRVHTGKRPYKCILCQKRFTQSGALSSHQKTHFKSKTIAQVQCSQCAQRFLSCSSLLSHFLNAHAGIPLPDLDKLRDEKKMKQEMKARSPACPVAEPLKTKASFDTPMNLALQTQLHASKIVKLPKA